jgi:hypothetical protein
MGTMSPITWFALMLAHEKLEMTAAICAAGKLASMMQE